METLTQASSAVEAFTVKAEEVAVETKNFVIKTACNVEDWCVRNPRSAIAIACFVVGFILGTLV